MRQLTEDTMQNEEVDNIISKLIEMFKELNLSLEKEVIINLINSYSMEMSDEDFMKQEKRRLFFRRTERK